ncbi:hypothetical protein R008_P11166 [Saccharomyces cerevisiae R008]|nr:hypothetical protein R008_P11166 [Saccharomyces cerevisiae R008]
MQTISGVLPTVLSPSELRSDDERTFQFDEEAEITTHLTESEDLRRLINETAQLGVRVDHIHDKTDQEIARLEKVIKEVTESDTFFRSCSGWFKTNKNFSDSESSSNTQLKSLSQLHGRYDRDWRQRLNKWFRKNKSKLALPSDNNLEEVNDDKVYGYGEDLMEQGKTPYFSDIDDFMNGLNIISPLKPDDFENDDTLVKIDETCQIHSASEPEKTSISPTFGKNIKKELVTDDTESIISGPPLQENKKTLLKYRYVRTSLDMLGSEKSSPKNNSGGMFRIFHKSANFGDKNQENVPRVWDTLRNNLGREIYLLQGRFKKWTTKHQNLKKGQPCKDEDAVTVPLPSSDPGKETQLETKLCFVPEPGDQPLVQA